MRPPHPRRHEGIGEDRSVALPGARPESARADSARAKIPESVRFAAAELSFRQIDRRRARPGPASRRSPCRRVRRARRSAPLSRLHPSARSSAGPCLARPRSPACPTLGTGARSPPGSRVGFIGAPRSAARGTWSLESSSSSQRRSLQPGASRPTASSQASARETVRLVSASAVGVSRRGLDQRKRAPHTPLIESFEEVSEPLRRAYRLASRGIGARPRPALG